MSSRLIPQNDGDICSTSFMISSGSCVLTTIGTASIFQNSLKSIAFHSITGNPAKAQRFHSHSIADQSLTTATEFDFQVYS
jgi:hypothetical protein